MRKEVFPIKEIHSKLYIEYDYITAGELGNILIRFQVATRSVAGFGSDKYGYLDGRPLILASTVQTKHSIEAELIVGIVGLVMIAPQAIEQWVRISSPCFHRLRGVLYALINREYGGNRELEIPTGLTINVTKGTINIYDWKEFLDTASDKDIMRLEYLIQVLFGPAKQVVLGDDDSEITISREL